LRHERRVERQQLVQIGLDLDAIVEEGAGGVLHPAARGHDHERKRQDDDREVATTMLHGRAQGTA